MKFVLTVCLASLILERVALEGVLEHPGAENILLDGCLEFLGDISLPSFSKDSSCSFDNHL